MLVAAGEEGTFDITFEVYEDSFHEQIIALNALDDWVSRHANERNMRLPAAKLGYKIGKEENTKKDNEDGSETLVATNGNFDIEEVYQLGNALIEFIKETPAAIQAQRYAGKAESINRSYQGEAAREMLAALEVTQFTPMHTPPFGFSRVLAEGRGDQRGG